MRGAFVKDLRAFPIGCFFMRPSDVSHLIGQRHVLSEGKPLARALETGVPRCDVKGFGNTGPFFEITEACPAGDTVIDDKKITTSAFLAHRMFLPVRFRDV